MKIRPFQGWFVLGLLTASLTFTSAVQADDSPSAAKPAIYDESADGSKQVADALALAGKDGKRVLLQFGANWCPWCHKLHALFKADKDIAARLKSDYVVVLIDVNKGRNSEVDMKYGHPTRLGLPVLVVLDADGKQLTTKDSGELEEGNHHSPAKVLAFLDKWSPKKLSDQPLSHSAPREKANITVNFQGMPLQQFLSYYEDLAGKKVTMAVTPTGGQMLSVTTVRPLTTNEALTFCEEVLKEQAGLIIVHERDGSLAAIQK
jgi:thioredoxin-related protein